MNKLKAAAVTYVLLSLALSGDVWGQSATVDFESLPVGTSFGQFDGNMPGDLIFTEDGVDVRVDGFTGGFNIGPAFNGVEIGGFTDPAFSTTPATLNNIRLVFDLGGLPSQVTSANFEFADFGGDENLVINGTVLQTFRLTSLPGSLAGVNIAVTNVTNGLGGTLGNVELTGPISSLAIGGQELGIDNVTFRFSNVPEPSSASLLAAVCSAAILRRRRRAIFT